MSTRPPRVVLEPGVQYLTPRGLRCVWVPMAIGRLASAMPEALFEYVDQPGRPVPGAALTSGECFTLARANFGLLRRAGG